MKFPHWIALIALPLFAQEPVRYEAGKDLTPEMAAFRDAWLGDKALHPLPKLVKYCPVCKRSWTFEYESCPFDGGTLQITVPKPGDEKRTSAAPPTPAGGRGGMGGRGGRGGGQ